MLAISILYDVMQGPRLKICEGDSWFNEDRIWNASSNMEMLSEPSRHECDNFLNILCEVSSVRISQINLFGGMSQVAFH